MSATINRGFAVIFILMALNVFQASGQDNKTHKAWRFFDKAKNFYYAGDYTNCEKELYNAIKADSTLADPYIMLGDLFLETARPAEAAEQYKKALKFKPEKEEVVCNLLANTLFSMEKYAEACLYYEELLGLPDLKQDFRKAVENKYQKAVFRNDLMENPVAFNPVNLGPPINTTADEYINSIAAEGSGVFFTRRMKSPAGTEKEFVEDFYYADMAGDSMADAIRLNYPPGKDDDAGAICLSPDGRLLFFTACFRTEGYGSCDLYFSEKTGDTWSVAKNMGAHINSASWDAQPSISPDGKTLYFASNRKGGAGSSDLWKTERMPDGDWGKPVNLGIIINTPDAEMAPFIHHDNQSLYFSSKGHPGMGGADLFKSDRKTGSWTKPLNLGYPINSKADELVVIVNPAGDQAYISSNSLEGEGGYDIFMFDLHETARPIPVSYLKGKVYDRVNGNPLEASFTLIDIELDSAIITAHSDRLSGEFLVCLPVDRNYALNVSCSGYLFFSEHFPFSEIKTRMDPVIKDIPLETIAVGKTMVLRNIFYETDQYQLKPTSFPELDKLVEFLLGNPSLHIEIGGHTDDHGTEEYNDELSLNRARAVHDYLLEMGIAVGRISFKGYGERRPFASNETDEGRALNRRTEITIVGSD